MENKSIWMGLIITAIFIFILVIGEINSKDQIQSLQREVAELQEEMYQTQSRLTPEFKGYIPYCVEFERKNKTTEMVKVTIPMTTCSYEGLKQVDCMEINITREMPLEIYRGDGYILEKYTTTMEVATGKCMEYGITNLRWGLTNSSHITIIEYNDHATLQNIRE